MARCVKALSHSHTSRRRNRRLLPARRLTHNNNTRAAPQGYDIPLDPSDPSAGAGPVTKRVWSELLDIQVGGRWCCVEVGDVPVLCTCTHVQDLRSPITLTVCSGSPAALCRCVCCACVRTRACLLACVLP